MKIRVSAVQYKLENIKSFEEFAKQCEHYVRTALEFGAEFVLFPEFFTTQLLSMGDENNALTINELLDLRSNIRNYSDHLLWKRECILSVELMLFAEKINYLM